MESFGSSVARILNVPYTLEILTLKFFISFFFAFLKLFQTVGDFFLYDLQLENLRKKMILTAVKTTVDNAYEHH